MTTFKVDEHTSDNVLLLAEVSDEMQRQIEKWGEQKHPLIYSDGAGFITAQDIALHFADEAVAEQRSNDWRAREGALDWRGILLEEVYEALGETDPEKAVTELIQVAAVALSTALSIGRYGLEGTA